MGAKQSAPQFDFVSTFSGSLKERYDVIRQLGAGAQGAAYLVRAKATQDEFVAKETHDMTADGKLEFLEEFNKMKELHHPNVSKVLELVEGRDFVHGEWKDQLYVISELAKGSDMHKYMKLVIEHKVPVTEEWVSGVFKQAMLGVSYIHSKDIVHNDLKPDNILMLNAFSHHDPMKVPWVVINDFGCATLHQDKFFKTGDPRYQSVESWEIITKIMAGDQQSFAKVSPKSDVWSMGVTLFELLSGGLLPFIYRRLALADMDEDMWASVGTAVAEQPVIIGEHCIDASPEVTDLLTRMFTKDLNQRPSAEEVLKHPWFEVKGKLIAEAVTRRLEFNASKGVAHQILANALSAQLQRTHYKDSWRIFQSLDKDNDGQLELAEFVEGCSQMSKDIDRHDSDPNPEEMFQQADIDKSGKIEFNEFMAATFDWSSLTPKQLQVNLQGMFTQLDSDGDGHISLKELGSLFQSVMHPKEIRDIFRRIDVDGDGKISKDEMHRFLFESATEQDVEKYSHVQVVRPIDRRSRKQKEAEVLGTCLIPTLCILACVCTGVCKPF